MALSTSSLVYAEIILSRKLAMAGGKHLKKDAHDPDNPETTHQILHEKAFRWVLVCLFAVP